MYKLIRLGATVNGIGKVSITLISMFCDSIFLQGESTPLHVAVQYNRVAVTEKLIDLGADVHAVDKVCMV